MKKEKKEKKEKKKVKKKEKMDISPDEDVTRTAQSTPASVRYGSLKKTVLFGKKSQTKGFFGQASKTTNVFLSL